MFILFFHNCEYCICPWNVQFVGSCFGILRDIDHFCWTQSSKAGVSEYDQFSILHLGFVVQANIYISVYFLYFLLHFCENSDDSDSLNRSFTCRMKCTLNHGGGFYKVITVLGPVVQRLDNVIHRINRYPADNCWQNKPRYPPDGDLSGG